MNSNFVIIGLPASGKTTYLAALWHVIDADEIECRLKLDRFEGDLKYLNSIAEAWRTFKEVPRTSQVGDKDIAIGIIDTQTGIVGRAFFPDLAGETFDVQIESRRCRSIFVNNVAAEDGILLFISVDSKQDSLSIVELNSMLPAEDGPAFPDGPTPLPQDQEGSGPSVAKEWQPKDIPAQVRIVQILSDLLRSPFQARQRRLAVILSAWDIVASTGVGPEDWLKRNMPLVYQFLATNEQAFVSVVFGISAQGLSLDDSTAIGRASALDASQRIVVVGPDGSDNDITRPIIWLMGEASK